MKCKPPHISSFSIRRNVILLMVMTLISLPMFTNCGSRRHDPRLERISEFVSESPEVALDSLEAINKEDFGESDRAYYNLLTIKARDKVYIVHTSDTLVLSVIDYYTDHRDDALTPEALYYGGRVYSDIGDYQTALNYFQQALDKLTTNTSDITLRGNVLSQTGGLLMDLGMFTQSIPYIKEVMEINQRTNDTLNLAYNNRMLGCVFMEMQEYDSAEYYFKKSLTHLKSLPSEFGIETQVFQAANKYERGEIDSALFLIRPTINNISENFKSYTLSYSAKIYYAAHLYDSAYLYSRKLINDPAFNNRKTGFMILLTPELSKVLPQDSVEQILSNYKTVLEDNFYNRQSEETLIQNSRYNYQVHDRNRLNAEIKSKRLTMSILTMTCILLVCIVVGLAIYLRYKNKIIELQSTISSLNKIAESLNTANNCSDSNGAENVRNNTISQMRQDFLPNSSESNITEQSLKTEIKEILESIKNSSRSYQIPERLLASETFTAIRTHISDGSIIPSSEEYIWKDLEKIVIEEFPNFIERLQLLLGKFPDETNLRFCMLLKCGVTSAQASRLFGRSKSSISYRRAVLCTKILGDKSKSNYLDKVIQAL